MNTPMINDVLVPDAILAAFFLERSMMSDPLPITFRGVDYNFPLHTNREGFILTTKRKKRVIVNNLSVLSKIKEIADGVSKPLALRIFVGNKTLAATLIPVSC